MVRTVGARADTATLGGCPAPPREAGAGVHRFASIAVAALATAALIVRERCPLAAVAKPRRQWHAGGAPREKRKTVTVPESCSGRAKPLGAGMFQPEISSFRLHLAAEGKAAKTVRTYTEAVQWFAAAHLRREGNRTGWEEVGKRDMQEWVAWLLGRYSAAYASNQYRALQQFFRWLAVEEEIPDLMVGLKPPRVLDKPVPVFAGDENSRGWSGRALAGASWSAATPRSSPSSRRPGYGCPS
jgi:hypothetical protein